MGDFDTSTGPRLPRPDVRGNDGEVDLLVYCTVSLAVTVAEPYTDDDLFEIARTEISWQSTLVSVDRVETDRSYREPMPEPDAAGHLRTFMDRLRRV